MEDEEDIFVGDIVTCVVRVVRANELKEGVTAKQVLAGEVPEESEEESEEEVKEEVKEKSILTAEEFEKLASAYENPERVQLERGVVYSKRWGLWGEVTDRFPFRIHEHWFVLLSDANDKYVMDCAMLTPQELLTEARIFALHPPKAEKVCYHLHFLCPCYVGLDFTVPVMMKVRPESEKPKVEINQKDLDLDKKKGLIDVGVDEKCDE